MNRAAAATLAALVLILGTVSAVFASQALSNRVIHACITSSGVFKRAGTCGTGGHRIS